MCLVAMRWGRRFVPAITKPSCLARSRRRDQPNLQRLGRSEVGPQVDFPLGNPTRFPDNTHRLHGSPIYWNGQAGPMIFAWGQTNYCGPGRLSDPD